MNEIIVLEKVRKEYHVGEETVNGRDRANPIGNVGFGRLPLIR